MILIVPARKNGRLMVAGMGECGGGAFFEDYYQLACAD